LEKNPYEMDSKELLEVYSHFNKMSVRTNQEQEYLAQLRLEILSRMDSDNRDFY
jgi:hypothetical protein